MRLLLLLFILSLVIRLYLLPHNLFFGYEQARDAYAIADLYHLKHFTLVGPKTDIDGVFHGPWYYYLMVLPYSLGGGNPLIASITLAILGSTVPIVIFFILKRVTSSDKAGFIGGLLTAFSFDAVIYSRWLHHYAFSFFLIPLFFLFIWLYRSTGRARYFFLSIISASLPPPLTPRPLLRNLTIERRMMF